MVNDGSRGYPLVPGRWRLRIEGWTFGGELRYHVPTIDPADVSIETGRTWPASPTDVFF